MAKIKLGDIFEIETTKGKGYLHYIYKGSDGIELIRVLPGLYDIRPNNLDEIASLPERYMVFFPIAVACRRKMVSLVGFYPPDQYKKPQYMRSVEIVRGEFLGWNIVNTDTLRRPLVEKLSPEQRKLSPWGIWSFPLLQENLENDWSLDKWSDQYDK